MHGILPAAGQAMRLRRLPKFLLPSDGDATTLIERHIQGMENFCDIIWLPVRADLVQLVHDLKLGERVIPVPLTTNTMTETVLRVASISGSDEFLLGMPDTAFVGEDPYPRLNLGVKKSSLSLALWKTASSQIGKVGSVEIQGDKIIGSVDKSLEHSHPYHWGAMSFNRSFIDVLDIEMPHTGYGIRKCIEAKLSIDFFISTGQYFDCGTFSEYQRYINCIV